MERLFGFEGVMIVIALGIIGCLIALWRMTVNDKPVRPKLDEFDVSDSPILQTESFWTAKKQDLPVRDIAFSREERELARQAANALQAVADSEPVETVNEDVAPKPKFDYPNYEGFPCDGSSFDEFEISMRSHGFVMRFDMKAQQVHVFYAPPKSRNPMDVLRRLYRAPLEIFPSNLLHEEGRKRTALWAMRKFKSEEKRAELDSFTYL